MIESKHKWLQKSNIDQHS